jgi:hypothetical protein
MNPFEKNPFHEVYVTDAVPEEEFVSYFSPYLVPHVPEVFLPGNVIVKGTQGCGKSMLLRLLEPEIRLAYFTRRGRSPAVGDFPVGQDLRKFIGARVNMSKNGLLDVTQTLSSKASEEEKRRLAITFGDYFNYWMLRDLLRTVGIAGQNVDAFEGIVDSTRLNDFAEHFASQQDCLFGTAAGVSTFSELRAVVDERIVSYRSWTNGNAPLPDSIAKSRTAIGEPISRAAFCLRESGALQRDARVFLIIDQIEAFWPTSPDSLGAMLRREIHELLGRRDGRVSWRLGARRYDWGQGHLKMRDGRELEEGRDYFTTDVDRLLRRKEHGTWPFKAFARDVFSRRLKEAFDGDNDPALTWLYEPLHFFGKSPAGVDWLESLVTNPPSLPDKLLSLESNEKWTESWKQAIKDCYDKRCADLKPFTSPDYGKDPVAALLMAAWGRQHGGRADRPERRFTEEPPVSATKEPWTKRWWMKERMPQVFLQITGRHGQRLYWCGWDHVLNLSGSNVTFLVRLCRAVWDMWRRLHQAKGYDPVEAAKSGCAVPMQTQWLAIHDLSRRMRELFEAQPGRPGGNVRMRFLDQVAAWLGDKLMSDKALSNPGHNGFTLSRSELEQWPELRALIEEAVGWGDLYEVEHTSKSRKEKAADPRRKFYLHPILSPYYQLPQAHTKEPVYNSARELAAFAETANLLGGKPPEPKQHSEPAHPELPFSDLA